MSKINKDLLIIAISIPYLVSIEKLSFTQMGSSSGHSVTVAAIGGFVGGAVFGALAMLLAGVVLSVVRMKRTGTTSK